MKKQLIMTLLLTLFIGVSSAIASERIDSLSYALGHQYTLGTMAGKNDLMQNEDDFKDYIRGLEENYHNNPLMNDSSYVMSYCLGAMEAVFLTDGMHGKKEELPPFTCIIAGLRKVGTGEISLPTDTVAAKSVINRYSREGMKPEDLDADTSCKFFEAYGTMKAYQPGLQEYINGLLPGTGCVADRKAFATGMADILETYTDPPKSAYDLGRMFAFSLIIEAMEKDSPDMVSLVTGAKAALGLGKEFIPRDKVEEILNLRYAREYEATRPIEDNALFETMMEYYDKFDVELGTSYSVDWAVTAGTVADEKTEAYRAFMDLVSALEIDDDCIPGILMVQLNDATGLVCDTAMVEIEKYPLPVGYKWFYGRNIDGQTTIGIMITDPLFKADVHKASAILDPMSGMVNVEWKFDVKDALKWAEFTAANIGRHVAMEIDGVFMFAPRVNQQISGGHCSISSLTPEEINHLFKNAKKEEDQTPVDTIEVIEIN